MRAPPWPPAAVLLALLAAAGCGPEQTTPSLATRLASDGEIVLEAVDGMAAATDEDLATRITGAGDARRARITIDDPIDGTVFPPDFTMPTFLWHDASEADTWLVEIEFPGSSTDLRVLVPGPKPPPGEIDARTLGPTNEVYEPTPYQASAHAWTPSPEVWEAIKRHSRERPSQVTVSGLRIDAADLILSSGTVTITTSKDPVGAPIFYRDVPLMPSQGKEGVISPLSKNGLPLIGWRLRDVSKPESRLLLTGMPSCANCHSFSLDGKTMGMDVDGPQGDKGAYMIAPVDEHMVVTNDEVITWNAFADKPKGHKTIGFLSRISPTGQYAVTTLNESLYVSNFTDYKFLQVFFPTRGILAWYSKASGEMKALPGADDTDYVQCDPAWYPDGEQIVFARARAFDPYKAGQEPAEYPNDPKEPKIQYDLYRMPFAEGKGGTPVPIRGASANGMSNTFPKISPDGKWLVFTKCANGQLMRPDGRLWIVPAEGGEAREMRCNTDLMNSWHSFSPNSRWMVFSSKINSPYTQIFLTHIDENGNDTPPVLIPNSTAANRAVNIPEFLNAEYEALLDIQIPAVNHHRHFGRAAELIEQSKYEEASIELRKAVTLDPDMSRAHVDLAHCLGKLGREDEAVEHYERALEINPYDPLAHNGLGTLLGERGEEGKAIAHFRRALAADPNLFVTRRNLGLAMARQGRVDEALVHLRRALQDEPRDLGIYQVLVGLLLEYRRTAEALPYVEAIVAVDPDDVKARTLWSWLLATSPQDSLRDGEKAVRLALKACEQTGYEQAEPLDALAAAYAEAGQFEKAVETAERALPQARGDALQSAIRRRLELYRQGRPYRVP